MFVYKNNKITIKYLFKITKFFRPEKERLSRLTLIAIKHYNY